MDKLEKAKEIIKENIGCALWGIFDTPNIVCDPMTVIYDDDFRVEICYVHGYFEVFGLSDKEFTELAEYYKELVKQVYAKIEE